MLYQLFNNTKPVTLFVVVLLWLMNCASYTFFLIESSFSELSFLACVASFFSVLIVLVLVSNINRRYEVTQNHSFSPLFFGFLLMCFPNQYADVYLMFSNVLIVLAMQRLMALHNGKQAQQKIFDASLLVVLATLFSTWAILFLLAVWALLLFYASKRKRYWFIPWVALLSVGIVYVVIAILLGFDNPNILQRFEVDFNFMIIHPIKLHSFYAVAVLFLMLIVAIGFFISKNNHKRGNSYQVLNLFLIISVVIALLSSNTIFIFVPLAFLFSLWVEQIRTKKLQEIVIWVLLLSPWVVLLLHFIPKSQIAGIT